MSEDHSCDMPIKDLPIIIQGRAAVYGSALEGSFLPEHPTRK